MYDEKIALLIDGQWRTDTAETLPLHNPATGEVIARVPCATQQHLQDALNAAQYAFNDWKEQPAIIRWTILMQAATLLEERKNEIAYHLTQENGKPLKEALGEIQFCADAIRWYAEEAKRIYGRIIPARSQNVRQSVLKEPLGPALGFAAWNFPAGNVTLKVAAAVAAGCSIIIKPSDETPGTAVAIGRCFQDAGLPKGVLNILFGPPAAISEYLIASKIPKKVSLTGSTPVGKHLQRLAADTLKRCTMELGGHAPVIVLADADLEKTLDTLVAAKFRNAGQVCTSPTRFYVHEKIYDQFIAGFKARAEKLKLGNGLDQDTDMGPLISKDKLQTMNQLVQDAVEKGATLISGGHALQSTGNFYTPTVLRDVSDDARIMNEEPFGPIAPISAFSDIEDVIQKANALEYGLAAYIFTQNGTLATQISTALNAGCVGINQTNVHEAETPFGGVNESGYGSEGGVEGLEAYLRTKYVAHNLAS
jgi:succinate-semialdehyde dehydrogenase / glutarate-semialdehyde dehydrogenase